MKKLLKAYLRHNPLTKPAIDQVDNFLYNQRLQKIKTKEAKGHALSNEEVQFLRVAPWIEVKGDKTLRLNYPLQEDSIVFDLGGYKGAWANEILNKYGSNIYIFEPYPTFAEGIKKKFNNNHKIHVFDFGLSSKTTSLPFSVSDDASSLFGQGINSVQIQLKNAAEFIQQNGITKIDLMKINIEGGEYDLLEHLIETGTINKIDNIQVQFHDFIFPGCKERMKNIQNNLSMTHKRTYNFEFVWENWKLNSLH